MLAASDFKAVVERIRAAKAADRPVIWGFGAHVIKTGLAPVLIDLMKRGYVSALATNGAGIIHDFEIALSGATSEDVDEALGPGRFGMAEETGTLLNKRDQRRRGGGTRARSGGGPLSDRNASARARVQPPQPYLRSRRASGFR